MIYLKSPQELDAIARGGAIIAGLLAEVRSVIRPGITTADISAQLGRPWEVFVDGVVAGDTPGETLEAVAARAQQVIDAIWPSLERGDVALFGHGHALRVLTAVWLGRSPRLGQHLILDPGSMSILTHHRSTRCIGTYNLSPWRLLRNSTTR